MASGALPCRRRGPGGCARIEHMFYKSQVEGLPVAGIPIDEDCFDPAWLDEAAWLNAASGPPEAAQPPVSACTPSGWLALELDQGCADPAALSDGELIDAVIGFDRVASWVLARQAVLLAEFARRRPEDHPLAANSDTPSRCSEFAPDEVALALRLSRMTATGRLVMAQTLVEGLPATLAAGEAGVIDSLKARAITEPPTCSQHSSAVRWRRGCCPALAPRRSPSYGPR